MGEATGLFLMGLAYGATVCSLTCLPCLGTYLMGCGNGFRDGVVASMFFMLGKVASYTIFGGLAGLLGHVLTLTPGQQRIIPGIALIGAALMLPFMSSSGCRQQHRTVSKRGSLLLLGVATSLVPCPPLAAILLLAAKEGSWLTGAGYGFLYGTGLMLSPLLIAGGGLALIAKKIRLEFTGFKPWLQGAAMLIMIIMGMQVLSAS
jgi:cytochrome c biogenesis protein CcdA